jgi:type IV pilus biogenesis/stability protein PilW
MSLIIDALKKAQQLRLKESKGTSVPPRSHPDNKRALRGLGKRWIIMGVGLASLIIFSLIFWGLVSPPSTSIPIRTVVRIEKKPSVPVEEKKPQEPSKDMMNSAKEVLSLPKDIPTLSKDQPLYPHLEMVWAGGGPSAEKKKEEPPLKQMPEKKEIAKVSSPIKTAVDKIQPPSVPAPPQPISKTSPPSLKEAISTKSIEVKQEDPKALALASEILTHFNLGVQFYNQRQFSKAIQAYQKVIALDPTYIEAYNNLGIIYQEIGDFDRAFEAFQKSIEINPQYEKGHNNLGILFYLKGRNEEALEAFQKALAINPNNIESHINLGVLFKKQGQLDKAIESYQKALDINPLHREIYYNIALLYEQSGNIELAISHYQQFIKLSSPSHSDLVSKVQRHLSDLMKARKEKRK